MTTQIVFVGHHKKRLLESIRALREYPVSKVILVTGEQESTGERIARGIAEEMADELKTVWDVEIVEMDKKNTIRAASQLVKIIEQERKRGEDVILNISGSLRTFSVAAYIAGCITSSKIISSIPKYNERDEEIGIEEIVDIPILPIDFPGREQVEIISAIRDGVESLVDLVFRLNPDIKEGSQEFMSERSRISHHLSKLEKLGFIKRNEVGRNVKIEVTGIGSVVAGVLYDKS